MDRQLAVVTGGGTGLGRSICHALAGRGMDVLAVGRRRRPLEETSEVNPQCILPLPADVAEIEGRDAIRRAVGERSVRCLVHNAGVLEPVGPLAGVDLHQWRRAQSINVEAPLFLSQALLDCLPGGRILHISSGAAHNGYVGWGTYCASKAALYMLYRVLSMELADRDIAVGSLRPGVVDTPMQALIRSQSPEAFPGVDKFLELHAAGRLEDPDRVAAFTAWLLLDVPVEQYRRDEWNFADAAQRAAWRE